jgi:hypothetical protein
MGGCIPGTFRSGSQYMRAESLLEVSAGLSEAAMSRWAALPVGDSRRPIVGRAIVGTLAIAAAFLVYIWTSKEIRFPTGSNALGSA